MVYGIAQELFA